MASERTVSWWLEEIEAARKREKEWRKEGQEVIDLYEGKKETPFNILYSNTETLLPALYSAVPRPVVQRRFKDEDPLGRMAAMAGQRVLEFLLDTNVDGYETFDEGVRSAVLGGLLPGRGVTTVKYDAEVVNDEYKASELVCVESRSWNRVYFGYAKKWSRVPWIAYEERIDREEAGRLFGKLASRLTYTGHEDEDEKDPEKKGHRKTATIYQVWDKDGGRKVRYLSEQYKDGFLRVDDDPLELTGFFNCPKPIQFLEKPDDMFPVALYSLYENQAAELNLLTARINRIVSAIKARGVYDSELGDDIGNLMSADENALVPADKSSSLAAEKGLQNAIWFMPVEQLITVLMQLYQARENCKRVIYEITGIADIMRGSSNASETLGAQEIKQHWGTLRLKRMQKEVQRYARDLLRLMLEVASTRFSTSTFARMTGLPFVTGDRKAQAMQIARAAQLSGQPVDGETQSVLGTPSWEEVLSMLRDDMQRAYRIDIETNSTVEPEAVEDQKNIAELMNALGQYLNGVSPLVVSGSMPFEAAQAMLLAIVRRFRFGPELEDIIKAMQAPQKDDSESQQLQAKVKELEGAIQDKRDELQQEGHFEQERLKLETRKAHDDIGMRRELGLEEIRSRERVELRRLGLQTEEEMMEPGVLERMLGTINESSRAGTSELAQAIAQMTQTHQQMQAQQMQAFLQGLQAIVAEINRPKRLVRDANGRPAGGETVGG